MKKALGEDKLPYRGPIKAPKPVEKPEESEEESSEDEEDAEKDSPGKPKSGQGKGKNMDNFGSEEESGDEGGVKKPKPIKMTINKMKKGKKGGKKKKLTNLNASDESGDGDSGSDFKPSGAESSNSEFVAPNSESEDSEEYDRRAKRKRGSAAVRIFDTFLLKYLETNYEYLEIISLNSVRSK